MKKEPAMPAEKGAPIEKGISLEKAFEKLQETVETLEKPEITLEEAFLSYKEGMDLLKYCNDTIDKVEKKVLMIGEDGELHEF